MPHYRVYNKKGTMKESFSADDNKEAEDYIEEEYPEESGYLELWRIDEHGNRVEHVCTWGMLG